MEHEDHRCAGDEVAHVGLVSDAGNLYDGARRRVALGALELLFSAVDVRVEADLREVLSGHGVPGGWPALRGIAVGLREIGHRLPGDCAHFLGRDRVLHLPALGERDLLLGGGSHLGRCGGVPCRGALLRASAARNERRHGSCKDQSRRGSPGFHRFFLLRVCWSAGLSCGLRPPAIIGSIERELHARDLLRHLGKAAGIRVRSRIGCRGHRPTSPVGSKPDRRTQALGTRSSRFTNRPVPGGRKASDPSARRS